MGKTKQIDVDQFMIRMMNEEDLEQVAAIEQMSFSSPWSTFAFQTELMDNNFAHYFIVADKESPRKVIGYGGLWVIIDEAHVTNIAIAPEYRGNRLGEALLGEMMAFSVARGAIGITLEVRASNASAQKLYERVGFKASGVRKGYYSDNKEDAVIMWCDLDGDVEVDQW